MTLNLTIPRQQHTDFSPRITVVGVGGAGCNAVNNMIAMGLDGVEFLVANTDAQALVHSRAERRVQLGPHLTQGLGAGAKPEIGRAAAEEATEDLARHLEGMHMVFITCGMGGGTGTGAAPVIARMARERGILTLGVVTKPFDFEGPKRRRAAEAGLDDLQSYVDTLIVIPNQNLFRKANERTTFAEAFKMADDVLYMGVRGVTDLMVNPGLVNLDFADIRTVMAEMGKAMMGTGEGEGEDRAVKAAEAAISNPLLEDTSMLGAKGVLINITGGYDMTLFEVDAAANRIRSEVDEDANIIFGSSVDEDMNGRIRVSVVATGIDAVQDQQAERPKLVAMGGGAGPANAMSNTAMPQQGQPRGVMGAPVAPRAAVPQTAASMAGPLRVGPMAGAPRRPAGMAPSTASAQPPAAPAGFAESQAHYGYEAPSPEDTPASIAGQADPQLRAAPTANRPVAAPAPSSVPPASTSSGFSLFRKATGLMRRNLGAEGDTTPPAPAPRAAAPQPAAQPPAQPQPEDMNGLDIPTFLRRQSN
ncbi:cell division protein FtsZ [Roseomonas marmotae]|uniref:Cell division protein FtsZ n=1 Tax=Roseomonas marmotae TaxID=2768161 RepID=A0ABS3KEM6_9PROT|nr:cell division protein FtsZ [Roseomonas marmotae]MBO1074811.1 cell division protein FtsZ [Roseomonas marmotae]QTI80681.1 cell division protein FtsZ [Roseomonas marmotae]